MTEHEDLLRQTAQQRGWTVREQKSRTSLAGVPYRKKNGEAGTCEISVDTEDDWLTMKAPENSNGARHAATLSGVEGGRAYRADGEPVGNVLWTDKAGTCVISIKRDDAEYESSWHALTVYAARVAGEVGREQREKIESIFRFDIEGEDDKDVQEWRERAKGQRIGIVGLGGVGLWILDLMSKTEVKEIRTWDGDEIEGRNLVRAPGWASAAAIGESKAGFFGEQYAQVRRGISTHGHYWRPEDQPEAFSELDFVFVAVDQTETRRALCEALEEAGIPFVDVGMGLERWEERVRGSCQVFFSGADPSRWRTGIPTAEGDGQNDYRALQLADLAALNAALAVGVWRRHIGQYEEDTKDWLVRYIIEENDVLKKTEQP